jgi:hypothetical protein
MILSSSACDLWNLIQQRKHLVHHQFLNTIFIRPPIPHEERECHDTHNVGLPVTGFHNPESVALPLRHCGRSI